jgi:hypothetical protein
VAFADRDPEQDVTPAAWVVAGVLPFRAGRVTSLVPVGFAAYARVFHPARAADGSPVRWASVAAANGRTAHPAMEWVGITGDWRYLNEETQAPLWDWWPEEGSLPPREAQIIAAVLSGFTDTDRWWFGLWEGFGSLPDRWQSAPRILMPDRSMYLFAGTQRDIGSSFNRSGIWHQTANLWWPDDRAWCVATDIDLMTTYVGASRAAVDALFAHPGLEAAAVPPDQGLGYDTDGLNPIPPRPH